jgi:hypothetical protein
MQGMSFPDSSIDVIIHSDTLEHVPDSKPALKESLARSETGWPFVLYCANRYWALDPDTTRFASQLSRKIGSEPGRLHDANGVRRRFLVRDFGGRISLTSLIFPASVAIHAIKP